MSLSSFTGADCPASLVKRNAIVLIVVIGILGIRLKLISRPIARQRSHRAAADPASGGS
jgi:hypothetical protein